MTFDSKQRTLTATQQDQVCGILAVGCDRETAANYAECTTADIHRTMERDVRFADRVRRTEGSTELTYMRTVHKAIEDPKNWRAAVWWLEMHAADRFKPRGAGEVSIAQLHEFLKVLSTIFCEEIQCETDRRRAIGRMYESIRELEELVRAGIRLSSASVAPLENPRLLLALTDDRDDESLDEDD